MARLLVGVATVIAAVVAVILVTAGAPEETVAATDSSTSTTTASTTAVPATTTTSTTTTTTTTTTLPPRSAQLVFTGDTLAHRGVVAQAQRNAALDGAPEGAEYDFAPMFDEVTEIIAAADLAICHLETPLSANNTNLSGYPTFNVPREMAVGLKSSGYDGCTYASNHSLDRRPEGVVETLGVLDEAGLQHSGGARDQAEYDEPTLYDAGGITVASLSYSYGFNGFREPSDTPWLVNEIDVDEIRAEVERSRVAGAEYIVLSLHWGTEYRTAPNEYQVDIAEQVAEIDGIDIVIGHHAHVVQPIGEVGELPVVFGLGNFLSNQSANCCAVGSQDGVIVQVNLQEKPIEDGPGFITWLTYVPTWVDRSDFTIRPVGRLLDDPALEFTEAERQVFAQSRARTAEAIGALGNPLTVAER